MPADFRTDVLIVGGGIAGLALAHRLRKECIPCLVLEARSRQGGRLEHSRYRTALERGAEFIHGNHRSIISLLKEAELEIEDYLMDGGEGRFFRTKDKIYDQSSAFGQQVEHKYELLHTHKGSDMSVKRFAETVNVGPDGPGFFARARVERLEGADLDDLSASALHQAMANVGNADRNSRVRGGFTRLVAWLSAECPIILGLPVAKIFWRDTDVCVVADDGSRFTAQNLVLTNSIDSLQSLIPCFDPLLPPEVAMAIKTLRMGVAGKAIVHVKRISWPNFSAYATDQAVQVWWNHHHDRGHALVGFTAGPGTEAFANRDHAEIKSQAINDIRKMGGKLSNGDILHVETAVWNRPGRMAYSYVPVGGSAARQALTTSLDDKIFFAGEAVVPPGLAGTIAGAIESAAVVARKISALHGMHA